ncbi:MAG: NAD(P)/FAD-dependent oxidoreductase, partial [Planctomycetes bacterium]|nr:NAD(P)/FAD-dependent oxidoreductase [Planctomycetota bacterium]
MEFDVCVVGGGAGGLMAGIFAGRGGGSVCVVERNSSVGRKLL